MNSFSQVYGDCGKGRLLGEFEGAVGLIVGIFAHLQEAAIYPEQLLYSNLLNLFSLR